MSTPRVTPTVVIFGAALWISCLFAPAWAQARDPWFDVDRRIANQEAIKADERLAVLETRLNSIETVGKGILVAVGAQLILSGLSFRVAPPRRPKRAGDIE